MALAEQTDLSVGRAMCRVRALTLGDGGFLHHAFCHTALGAEQRWQFRGGERGAQHRAQPTVPGSQHGGETGKDC